MRIKNKNITNKKLLKEYFDFDEIFYKLDIFVNDISEIVSTSDKQSLEKLKELIAQCISKGRPSKSLPFEKNSSEYDYYNKLFSGFDTIYNLKNKLKQIQNISDIQALNASYCAAAIYYISGVKFDESCFEYIFKTFSSSFNAGKSETFLNIENSVVEIKGRAEPYKINLWDGSVIKNNYTIKTVKIINSSLKDENRAIVHVIGKNESKVNEIIIPAGKFTYINTVDGSFIEELSNISTAESYCAVRNLSGDENGSRIARINFCDNKTFIYDFDTIKNITSFSVDDNSGFLGVLNDGSIIPFSERVEFRYIFRQKNIVKIALYKSNYIILKHDGTVVTDIPESKSWSNMASVFFSDDGCPYGIKIDGSVVSASGNSFSSIKHAVSASIYKNKIIYKDYEGKTLCEEYNINQNDIKSFFMGENGIILLYYDGSLLKNSFGARVLSNIREMSVFQNNIAALDNDFKFIYSSL